MGTAAGGEREREIACMWRVSARTRVVPYHLSYTEASRARCFLRGAVRMLN